MSETRPMTVPDPERRSPVRRLFWIIPVLTFVVGLLLGGGVIAASKADGDDGTASTAQDRSGAGPTASPLPSGDATITVPASCADGLDRAERAFEAADAGLAALRDLDTAKVRQVLDELQRLRPEITRLAGACRTAVTDGE
ncbi:MAG TPA: hypothetical protein VI357_01410 [Mycobacteriales bacterium]